MDETNYNGCSVAIWEEKAPAGYVRYSYAGLGGEDIRFQDSHGFVEGSGLDAMAREVVDCVKRCLRDCPESHIPKIVHNRVPAGAIGRGLAPLPKPKEAAFRAAVSVYLKRN